VDENPGGANPKSKNVHYLNDQIVLTVGYCAFSVYLGFELGIGVMYMYFSNRYFAFIWGLGFLIWDLFYALDPH
jgi:hypothetical protein